MPVRQKDWGLQLERVCSDFQKGSVLWLRQSRQKWSLVEMPPPRRNRKQGLGSVLGSRRKARALLQGLQMVTDLL